MSTPQMMLIKPRDRYGASLIFSILGLFALMMYILFKLQSSEPAPSHNNGFIVPPVTHKTIYLMTSKPSALLYAKSGHSLEEYTSKIKQFAKLIHSLGYTTKLVPSSELSSLPKAAILFIVDAPAMTQETKKAVKSFVQNGGNLFFNFTAGYSDENGKYLGSTFVHTLTGLSLNKRLGFVTFKDEKGNGSLFVTPKLLSPLSLYLPEGKNLFVVLYDKVPLYDTPTTLQPDMMATSFSQATPPVATDAAKSIRQQEAGMAWHGYYGKGKWIYTAMPSYAFTDNREQKDDFKKLLSGIIAYLAKPVTAKIYPFIDNKGAIFISEDTEYKFTNFERFADLAKEYRFPVTAFIVANLAQKPEHKAMMERIAQNPYVEFASHSTSHKQIVGKSETYIINETAGSKKILDKFASSPIQGFRPPREELNDLMRKHLAQSGFTYILGATEEHLYPEFDKKEPNLLIIPRHGTDDFSYLVNLDWDQDQIVRQMIREANFVTALNGIYTLSIHTHLFAYSTNINIMKKFFHYLSQHPEFKIIGGKALYQNVRLAKHLSQKLEQKGNQYIMTVTNDNDTAVNDLYIQLFKNPKAKITSGSVNNKNITVKINNSQSNVFLNTVPAKSTVKIYFTLENMKG